MWFFKSMRHIQLLCLKKTFESFLKQFPWFFGPLGTFTVQSAEATAALAKASITEQLEAILSHLNVLEQAQVSTAESYQLSRRTNRTKYANVSRMCKKNTDNIDELRQKGGRLHESVVRLSLEGSPLTRV